MAGQRSSKKKSPSAKAKGRRHRRAIGLGSSAGAFLAFGLTPLAGAPSAKADVFDDILDMAVGSAVSSAVTAVNPTDFLDPAVLSGLLGDLGTPSGFDAGFAAASAVPTADSATTFLQGLEQDWINSPLGQSLDTSAQCVGGSGGSGGGPVRRGVWVYLRRR